MMHKGRSWNAAKVATREELAEKLTENTWTLCAAFRCLEMPGVEILNDAFSEDGAQEYGVIYQGRQIDSLTVDWMRKERLLEYLKTLPPANDDDFVVLDRGPLKATQDPDHVCRFCR